MINPGFLKTFVVLSEVRSFTRTAEQMCMTQPGVTQHIKALEAFYGRPLLTRTGKSLELTRAGLEVLSFARQFFSQHDQLLRQLDDDSSTKGLCRFASPGAFGMKMYSFLQEVSLKHRELVIHYSYAPDATVLQWIADDVTDLGFVTKSPTDERFAQEKIDEESLALITPADFRGTTLEDLQRLGFVGHPDGNLHATRLLRANFPSEFVSMEQIPLRAYNNQITRIPEPVALGLGFTVLPENACRSFPAQDRIRYFPLRKVVRYPLFAIWKQARPLPQRFRYLLDLYAEREGKSEE